jgi:hypothetical protein
VWLWVVETSNGMPAIERSESKRLCGFALSRRYGSVRRVLPDAERRRELATGVEIRTVDRVQCSKRAH